MRSKDRTEDGRTITANSPRLEQSRGELYYYHLLGKKGLVDAGNRPAVEDEEGWLILSNGKIFKKYVAGNGVVSENAMKEQGLK